MSSLYLYDAAAGAGKTHALVSYYILQLLKASDRFSHILAITFTNMATQEMKERILLYLHRLSNDELPDLRRKLAADLDCSSDDLMAKAENALATILHHYHDFTVITIDSFFDKVIRSFQREHGLGIGYALELDEKRVLRFCLEELIERLPDDPALANQLTDWSLGRLEEGVQWDIGKEVLKIGHDMLKRSGLDPEEKEGIVDQSLMNGIFDDVVSKANRFRKELGERAATMIRSVKDAGLSVEDFSWGKQGVVGFFEKVVEGKQLIPSKRVRAALEGRWEKKSGKRARLAHELVATTLRPLLFDWLMLYDEGGPFYHAVGAMIPLRYAFSLAQRMRQLIEKYEREHDVLLMAHLPLLLGKTMKEVSPNALFWKMGSEYDLLLVDELQDVSRSQWGNLVPLLEASVASQRESLLVGDVKQSIYRWRGGEPEIFLRGVVEDLGSDVVKKRALEYNWRSGKAIIHFNNGFFERAAKMMASVLMEEVSEATNVEQAAMRKEIAQIRQAYEHVKQAVPERDRGFPEGCVEVMLLPRKKEEDPDYHWKEEAIRVTIGKIEELQEHGYAAKDIALLVRDHAEAKSLVKGLMAYQESDAAKEGVDYDVTTANGLTVEEHPAIRLLVAALGYLVKREDKRSLVTLRYYYQLQHDGKGLETEVDWHACFAGEEEEERDVDLPTAFYEEFESLRSMPLSALVVKLILLFKLEEGGSTAYLAVFREVVHEFVQREQGDITDFISWWEELGKQVKLPSHAGSQMSIITIHQSKGLAFPVVLLPFCAWRLDHSPYHPPMLWCQSKDSRLAQLGKVPLYYGKKLKETLFASFYYGEKWRVYLEQLNLLYVAFTRAIGYLGVVSPCPVGSGKMSTVADLVGKVASDCYDLSSTGCLKLGGIEKRERKEQVLPKKDVVATDLTYTLTHENDLCRLIAGPPHAEGVWWHDFLSNIRRKDDLVDVLATYKARGELTAASAKTIEERLTSWWKNKEIASWFGGGWEVEIERAILLPKGEVVRPDRVMVRNDEAIVLDFKTGVPKREDEEQVARYVQLLEKMNYKEVKGYLLYIATGNLVAVRR